MPRPYGSRDCRGGTCPARGSGQPAAQLLVEADRLDAEGLDQRRRIGGLVGGLGLVPGANLGVEAAVFEAVHGSAPDIAGQGVANPTALLLSAVMMLRHIGEDDAAARIRGAIDRVYATGVRTRDLGGTASTREFTSALCRLL